MSFYNKIRMVNEIHIESNIKSNGWPWETTGGPLETTGDHRGQFPRTEFGLAS